MCGDPRMGDCCLIGSENLFSYIIIWPSEFTFIHKKYTQVKFVYYNIIEMTLEGVCIGTCITQPRNKVE